jgi:hypothetical protein
LGDAVGANLRGRNVDPGSVDWDAWRREDGRWTLTATFPDGRARRTGGLHLRRARQLCLADDDEARWLVGDGRRTPRRPRRRLEHRRPVAARRRRLAAVPPDELPSARTPSTWSPKSPIEPAVPDSLGSEAPVEAYLDDEPAAATPNRSRDDHEPTDESVDDARADEPPAARQAEGPRFRAELGRDHVRRRQAR